MREVNRCVVCRRRLKGNHRCPKFVLELYGEAERLVDLADDPEEPGMDPIDPGLLRKFRTYGLILEFAEC